MVKKWIIIGILTTVLVTAQENTPPVTLENACLACHQKQQIPSDLIYRRYLMRYSTPERIQKAMVDYLKAPSQSRSIMPPQFFLKFPMKAPLGMDEATLQRLTERYIERFDTKKRLLLKKIKE